MQRSTTVSRLLVAALFFHQAMASADDAQEFAAIDRHALAAPPELQSSPQRLVEYLVAPAKNDVEKARAIFRWMAQNVAYDIDSYKAGVHSSSSIEDVLRTGKGMCSGYANLFEELARRAGLEVVSIAGYVKGFDYRAGDPVGAVNHDWNALKLQGRWQLLDSTWGAGGIDETGNYRRRFQPHYFLTDPARLAFTHWPADTKWRLLESDMSSSEFAAQVRPTPAFFELGLGLGQQRNNTLQPACNRFEVQLDVPLGVALTATLSQPDKLLERATLVQRNGRAAVVLVQLPDSGEYRLNLYARQLADKTGVFAPVLNYRILAAGLGATSVRLPESYVTFRESLARIEMPVVAQLANGQPQLFALTVPGAVEVAVVSAEGQWFRLARDGQRFAGDALISGHSRVVASFDETGKNYFTLLEYSGMPPDALPPTPEVCAAALAAGMPVAPVPPLPR